jgi:hypothetical protein
MELNTQEILKAQFYTLPLAVQDIINENEWRVLIKELSADYRLHQDQADIIESITLLTILGFANTEHFSQNVVEESKIDLSIANEIGKKINLEVFDLLEEVALLAAEEEGDSLDDDSLLILDDARSSQTKTDGLDDLDLSKESDLAAKKLLDEIENPENYLSTEFQGKADTHLQKNVDSITAGESEQEPQDAPKGEEDPQTRPATHMRPLKSDIVKAKLENPSWEPQITKSVDDDVVSITQEALKETQKITQNSQEAPIKNDLYREDL